MTAHLTLDDAMADIDRALSALSLATYRESAAAERLNLSVAEFRAACERHHCAPMRERRRGPGGEAIYLHADLAKLQRQLRAEVQDRRTWGVGG